MERKTKLILLNAFIFLIINILFFSTNVNATECDNTLSTLPCNVTSNLTLIPGNYYLGSSDLYSSTNDVSTINVYDGITFDGSNSNITFSYDGGITYHTIYGVNVTDIVIKNLNIENIGSQANYDGVIKFAGGNNIQIQNIKSNSLEWEFFVLLYSQWRIDGTMYYNTLDNLLLENINTTSFIDIFKTGINITLRNVTSQATLWYDATTVYNDNLNIIGGSDGVGIEIYGGETIFKDCNMQTGYYLDPAEPMQLIFLNNNSQVKFPYGDYDNSAYINWDGNDPLLSDAIILDYLSIGVFDETFNGEAEVLFYNLPINSSRYTVQKDGIDQTEGVDYTLNDAGNDYINITVPSFSTWSLSEIIEYAPIISNVQSHSITKNSAIISWDTDKNAKGVVNYGITNELGTYESNNNLLMSQNIQLTNLTSNTTYYYNISSCDYLNNCNNTIIYNFTTAVFIPTYGVNLTQPETQRIANTTYANYTITITNNGTIADNYIISLTNQDNADTAELNQTSISDLAINDSVDVILTVGNENSGNYTILVTATSQGNTNVNEEISITTEVIPGPSINSKIINPHAIINGSNITLSISTSNQNKTWAIITKPDSTQENINLTNDENTSFFNTSLIGRYDVTFYANDSMNNIINTSDYFESFRPILFNFTIIDNENEGINSDWEIYYRNQIIASNSSETGNNLINTIDTIVNLKLIAHQEKLQITLRDINLTLENNKEFGMDKFTPESDYLISYGINNNYSFTNATIRIYYDDLSYSNEENLQLYKCNTWNFSTQTCSGSYIEITSESTQNTDEQYFEYDTLSFSGFSIKEYIRPSGGSSRRSSRYINTPSEKTTETITEPIVEEIIPEVEKKSEKLNPKKTEEVSTEPIVEEEIPKKKNPSQLFDIRLELDSSTITDSKYLSSVTRFESFGSVPTPVDLTYRILNSLDEEVYFKKGNVTVTTEQIVRNNYENLELTEGEYTLILTTVYSDNITDDFKQEFTILEEKDSNNILNIGIILLSILGLILIIFSIYIIKKKYYKIYYEKYQYYKLKKRIMNGNNKQNWLKKWRL